MSDKLNEAVEFFKKKQFKEAIDAFSVVLEQEPDNAEVYNNIGVAYLNLSDYEHAEKSFFNALKINQKLVQPYINLSDVYYRTQNWIDGINLLLEATCELPDNMLLKHYWARFYMEDSRYEDAIDELDKILEKEPENFDAYYDLGRVYFERGDWECAITNFENVLEHKKTSEWVYYYLAEAYEANGEVDKAISNYLKSITVNDKFHPPYKKLGVLFLARNDWEDAVEYFEDYMNFDIGEEEKQNVGKLIERIKEKNEG